MEMIGYTHAFGYAWWGAEEEGEKSYIDKIV